MCGIYLTVVENARFDYNQISIQQTQQQPPKWLVRRGPDAWDSKIMKLTKSDKDGKYGSTIITVTLHASVLQMRDMYVTQPREIKSYTTDKNPNFLYHPIRPQWHPDDTTIPNNDNNYIAWNGEIYQMYNINTHTIDNVYEGNISDTMLVTKMLYEQVTHFHRHDYTTREEYDDSSDDDDGTSTAIITQRQIGAVMSQLTNAEYAFCIVTKFCIYYGRDSFGRRSLLQCNEKSPSSNKKENLIWGLGSVASDFANTTVFNSTNIEWNEIEPGQVHAYILDGKHIQSDDIINNHYLRPAPICPYYIPVQLVPCYEPPPVGSFVPYDETTQREYCAQLHSVLLDAVRYRCYGRSSIGNSGDECINSSINSNDSIMVHDKANGTSCSNINNSNNNIGVLFSGGLDSVVVAALVLEANVSQELTLLTVSFIDSTSAATADDKDKNVTCTTPPAAADAIAAEESYHELCHLFPCATIHFLHKIVEWDDVKAIEKHIQSLAYPRAESVMDLNIATALWFAASTDAMYGSQHLRSWNKKNSFSPPRILLSGLGADEFLGGYGRHRDAFIRGQYFDLFKELQMDINRLWERNLGRDDRIISDTGKEVRFPYLDIHVERLLRMIPLQYIVDYTMGAGVGDKRILRLIAREMVLFTASTKVKRAIQFGSRISHVSDKRRFGSRRKASSNVKQNNTSDS